MAFLFGATTLRAEIPRLLSYQGVLTNEQGAVVPDDSYPMTFLLYDSLVGGSARWLENRPVQTTNGVFEIYLGEVTPLTLPFDRPYYLESVFGGVAHSPRTRLSPAPYSLRAAEIENDVAVREINGLQDQVTIAPGAGTQIQVFRDTLQISLLATRLGTDVSGATTDIGAEWTNYAECSATVHATGPGLVVVESVVQIQVSHTNGTPDRIQICHARTQGEPGPAVAYYSVHHVPAEYPTFANSDVTLPVRTVFEVQGAEDLTFFLNGRATQGVGGDRFWYASLTATFFPQDEVDELPSLDGRPPHVEKPSR
ncbi:MAG: hypothetical protein H6506_01630 [Calditrichaeota bacterium]|nr:hypothetical protein [Calditrichota bacterium]